MESRGQIQPLNNSPEAIDFNKLGLILKSNRIWILLIFILINTAAYLIIRYSKEVYESHSELKLDIKSDATELGFKPFVEDQNLNIISGEIELIQSRLFLSRLLDSIDLNVSYFNSGEILDYEFFGRTPYTVEYQISNSAFYNTPFYIEEEKNGYTLQVGQSDLTLHGQFEKPLLTDGLKLTLSRNKNFDVSENLHCFFIINSREVLLNYLLTKLSVEPLNFNANTIRISFKDHNPVKASTIVNKIDSLYLNYSNEQKNLTNKQKIDWLTNELQQIESKMGEYENYFEDFILTNKTNNLDKELDKTIQQISSLDSQRFEATKKIGDLNHLIDNLAAGELYLTNAVRSQFPESINEKLKQLEDYKADLNKVKLSYKEVTIAVQQREYVIKTSQDNLIEELGELKKNWLNNLLELNKRKSKLESKFAKMPDQNTEFNKNERFYSLYEQFYLTLMQSKSEFEIAKAGSIPDFKILSPASFSGNPIAPNKLMIAGIGLVASIMINLFFIGILYILNNKINTIADLDVIQNVPLLGVIPFSKDIDGYDIHIVNHPKSMVSEAFRTLRTNLDFIAANATLRTIAISSTVSGEGKSYVALNLGAVMALSRKKVILLDLDLRKSKADLPDELKNSTQGISTVLIRKNTWQECVVKTKLEGLDYLPAGPHPPNPSELLLNGEFESLLNSLKEHYDFILMDTPPVGLVTDGIMAMKHADVSIYIARANYSKKEFLLNLKRIISINKFSNITTVLNALPSRKTNSYGYGYYEDSSKKKTKKA